MEGDLCASWENLRGADARHVLRRNALGMRACPVCHGAVLLSERPEGLSRHRILSGSRAAFPWLRCRKQELPILPGLCDHARGRPPRAEFAWHPTAGTAGAARYGYGCAQTRARLKKRRCHNWHEQAMATDRLSSNEENEINDLDERK